MISTAMRTLITEWAHSRRQDYRIAAQIGIWASRQPAGTPVPDDDAIAGNLDFVTTPARIAQARKLLVDHGVLTTDAAGDYYIA